MKKRKIEAIFQFLIRNDKWKSENWTYFLIFIFKLKMKMEITKWFLFSIVKLEKEIWIVE